MKRLSVRFSVLLAVLLLTLGAGTIGFSIVEGLSPFDAFYLTVVTVATVGYGDVHPVTEAGRVVAICIIIIGVGAFSAVIVSSAGLLFERRQEDTRRQRTNILIGLFFSEVGTPLLEQFVSIDPKITDLRGQAIVQSDWTAREFVSLRTRIVRHKYELDGARIEFDRLKSFLNEKTDFLIRLIESPSLLEHESFTELLQATIHLREELSARNSFNNLPQTDVAHLSNDSKRVYLLLTEGWVEYMRYLKTAYPYLFSLAVRNNPFNEKHSAIVR